MTLRRRLREPLRPDVSGEHLVDRAVCDVVSEIGEHSDGYAQHHLEGLGFRITAGVERREILSAQVAAISHHPSREVAQRLEAGLDGRLSRAQRPHRLRGHA